MSVPFDPNSLTSASTGGVAVDINLFPFAAEATRAVIARIPGGAAVANKIDNLLKPFVAFINNAIVTSLKAQGKTQKEIDAVLKALPKAVVLSVSGSTPLANSEFSLDANGILDILDRSDSRVTLKFDRTVLRSLSDETVQTLFALVSRGVFGGNPDALKTVGILANGSNIQDVGDIRFSYSIVDIFEGKYNPTIGFNIKTSKAELAKNGRFKNTAFTTEFVIFADLNGKYTFQASAKIENSSAIGKVQGVGSTRIQFDTGDIFLLTNSGEDSTGQFAIRVKLPNNQEAYILVPPSALLAAGFSSSDLALAQASGRTDSPNGSTRIKAIPSEDLIVIGIADTLGQFAQYENQFQGATGILETGGASVAFFAQFLIARQLVSKAGPYGAVLAYLPEIFQASANIFTVFRNAYIPELYKNTSLVQSDAKRAFSNVLGVLRDSGVDVDELGRTDPKALNDVAFAAFVRQAIIDYPPSIASRLIFALVSGGVVGLDTYSYVFDAGSGSIDELNTNGGFSTGDGTLGSAIAVLKQDPFARALDGLTKFESGVNKAFDLKLLFGQQNEGDTDYFVNRLLDKGVDPFALELALGVLYNASSFRSQYRYSFDYLNNKTSLGYDYDQGDQFENERRLKGQREARIFSQNIIFTLFGDYNFQRLGAEGAIRTTSINTDKNKNVILVRGLSPNELRLAGITSLDDIPKALDLLQRTVGLEEYSIRLQAFGKLLWENGREDNWGRQDLKGAIDRAKALDPSPNSSLDGVASLLNNRRNLNSNLYFSGGAADKVSFSDTGVLVATTDLQSLGISYDDLLSRVPLSTTDIIIQSIESAASVAGSSAVLAESLRNTIIALFNSGETLAEILTSEIEKINRLLVTNGQQGLTVNIKQGQDYLALYFAGLDSIPIEEGESDTVFQDRVRETLLIAYLKGNEFIRDGLLSRIDGIRDGTVRIDLYIDEQLDKSRSLTEIRSALNDALAIARATGNALGVILADIAKLFVDTQLAGLDGRTALDRQNSAIETGARLLGVTFSDFVRLIGRGDLAAFGAVIGDAGEFAVNFNVAAGQSINQVGATADGFSLIGDALVAAGRSSRDATLIIAGTAVASISGVIDGLFGVKKGRVSAVGLGFGAAGQIASVLGELSGSKNS